MLLKILFFISFSVLFVKAIDDQVLIDATQNTKCTIKPHHTFTNGQTVAITTDYNKIINFITWKINETDFIEKAERETNFNTTVHTSMAGKWEFELLHLQDNTDFNVRIVQKNNHTYTQRVCSTNVEIVPAPPPPAAAQVSDPKIVIMLIALGVVFTIIIFAQAAYIIYLKSKARSINRLENLSKKSETTSTNDRTRYCSNPGQKMVKIAPMIDPDGESDIYEAPQIELSGKEERAPAQPPQPPAVNTIPRTPRIDTDRLGPLALAAAISARQAQTGTYPTQKPMHHEINVANRPPLPLPPQETYEEMLVEENTYEPPPIKTALPPVKPSIPQKLTKDQLDTAVKALTTKPAVTPKPPRPRTGSDTMKIPNELENAWRRRNVVQVPIMSIPGPSSRNGSPHRHRPPPVVKSKPPIPQPVDEGIYYNHRQDSSDEEWTYEPLKPVKAYNNDNIYNV
ncbi:unnamed protein product [Chrysodeixis includens]|uniref:Uncharacterized protein n=1 Tax=Chrysodeixis includens TaxID=689277 RepID=A0A9P0BT80_CHRIL|nr:unnamed protein product [Chrysodeixis includens]